MKQQGLPAVTSDDLHSDVAVGSATPFSGRIETLGPVDTTGAAALSQCRQALGSGRITWPVAVAPGDITLHQAIHARLIVRT